MPELAMDCPHCRALRSAFDFEGESAHGFAMGADHPSRPVIWNTFWTCRVCREGVVVKLQHQQGRNSAPSDSVGVVLDEFFLVKTYPIPEKPLPPEDTPEHIFRDYQEAVSGLSQGSFTSAGIMFRRVLEKAAIDLLSANPVDSEGARLYDRIRMLAEHRLIIPEMEQWLHHIRLEGNDAAHEDFSKERAEELKEFIDIFLISAYTLRERMKRASKMRAGGGLT